jgi:hypothetical protein
MEMMAHDAGVKNIVVGGRPAYGPMQTPSGSRGARFYDLDALASDVENALEIANLTAFDASLLAPLNYSDFPFSGGVSLRAQVREGETVPLAMQYEAASCRIFWTPDTFNNFTNLWKYANRAATSSPSLCVQGSTGYAGPPQSALAPPERPHLAPVVNYTSSGAPSLDLSDSEVPFLVFAGPVPDVGGAYVITKQNSPRDQQGRSVSQPRTQKEREDQRHSAKDKQKQEERVESFWREVLKKNRCKDGGPLCERRLRRRGAAVLVGN